MLQELKFELLSEYACHAVVDGYYREAVASFTAAMERFFEFYMKVILHTKGVNVEGINSAWKEMSRQSERQLGAFIMTYTLENKKAPTLVPKKQIEFRNDVIHKGLFPSREQTIKFGQAFIDCVHPVMLDLKQNYAEAVKNMILSHLKSLNNMSASTPKSTMGYPTMLNLTRVDNARLSLSDWLEHLDQRRKTQGW